MSDQANPAAAPSKLKTLDMRAVAPFIALALLLVVGAMVNPNFIGLTNLANVATRAAFIAIIAVGATFVISSGDLDLSVGSMVAFVASVMILFMNSGGHRQLADDDPRGLNPRPRVGGAVRVSQWGRSQHGGAG